MEVERESEDGAGEVATAFIVVDRGIYGVGTIENGWGQMGIDETGRVNKEDAFRTSKMAGTNCTQAYDANE